MLVGELIGLVITVFMNGSYARKLLANNNVPVPEWRLPLAMAGAPIFAGMITIRVITNVYVY